MGLPEPCLRQNPVDALDGLLKRMEQRLQKPDEPFSDVQASTLGRFQNPVVVLTAGEDARGHGIKADGLMFALSHGQISDYAGQTSVAIVERVQRHEPEMRNACADQRVEGRVGVAAVEPVEKIIK